MPRGQQTVLGSNEMNIGTLEDAMVPSLCGEWGRACDCLAVILASASKSVGCDGVKPMKLPLI